MTHSIDKEAELVNEIQGMICDWNSPSQLAVDMKATCERIAKWHTQAKAEAKIDTANYFKKYMISTSPFIEAILDPYIDELKNGGSNG